MTVTNYSINAVGNLVLNSTDSSNKVIHNVQTQFNHSGDARLVDIQALAPSTNDILYYNGSNIVNIPISTVLTDALSLGTDLVSYNDARYLQVSGNNSMSGDLDANSHNVKNVADLNFGGSNQLSVSANKLEYNGSQVVVMSAASSQLSTILSAYETTSGLDADVGSHGYIKSAGQYIQSVGSNLSVSGNELSVDLSAYEQSANLSTDVANAGFITSSALSGYELNSDLVSDVTNAGFELNSNLLSDVGGLGFINASAPALTSANFDCNGNTVENIGNLQFSADTGNSYAISFNNVNSSFYSGSNQIVDAGNASSTIGVSGGQLSGNLNCNSGNLQNVNSIGFSGSDTLQDVSGSIQWNGSNLLTSADLSSYELNSNLVSDCQNAGFVQTNQTDVQFTDSVITVSSGSASQNQKYVIDCTLGSSPSTAFTLSCASGKLYYVESKLVINGDVGSGAVVCSGMYQLSGSNAVLVSSTANSSVVGSAPSGAELLLSLSTSNVNFVVTASSGVTATSCPASLVIEITQC
jgi:hypothetical protein